MKLPILIAGILAIAIPSIASAQGFETNLIYGMRANTDVRELQDFLKDQGFFRGPITGNYFSLTRSAVIRFQIKNGVKPANGQFTTTTREIAQKMIDPEQDVQEMPTTTSYLDYPIGTYLLPSSSTTYPVLDGSTSNLQPSNPTIIYYPVYVPQNEPIVGSNEIQVVQTSSPVVEAPKDTTAPKVVYEGWTTKYISTRTASYGSFKCMNCIAIFTDEPTKINLEYIKLQKTDSGSSYNFQVDSQNNPIAAGPIQIWTDDGKISDSHIFITKPLMQDSTSSQYTYRFSVTDAAGNTYKTLYTGSYQMEVPWTTGKVVEFVSSDDPNIPSEFYTVNNGVRTNY